MATAFSASTGLGGSRTDTAITRCELSHSKFVKFSHSQSFIATKFLAHPNDFSSVSLRIKGAYPAKSTTTKEIEISTDLPEHGKPERAILVIDNYDSFTYNLCQYLGDLGASFDVCRNDELTVEEVRKKNPRGILISPGPGTPHDSGISLQTVYELGPTIPLFGVCMGLQCIGEAFGGKIVRSPFGVMHGKRSLIYYDEKGEDGIFVGLPNPFTAGRYHSLVIEKESFPHDELEITAWTDDGLIMGVRHKKYRHIQAVQFHPESIITPEGKKIVQNFINIIEQHKILLTTGLCGTKSEYSRIAKL
jgi:anthranilate synthase component 2